MSIDFSKAPEGATHYELDGGGLRTGIRLLMVLFIISAPARSGLNSITPLRYMKSRALFGS